MAPSKEDLRREMRRRIDALPPGRLIREGREAGRHLAAASCWGEYPQVLLFLSNSREIDTAFLLEAALSQGKRVFVPKVEGEELRFYRIRDAKGPWQNGPFGIREPLAPLEAAHGETLGPGDFPALIILPGIAFDRAGGRLGHGKGFYDRFLAKAPGLRVGFCAEFQVAPEIPVEPWDQRVDALCTGQGFTLVAKTG